MPDANDEIVKLWLETNFAEATKKGEDALKELRETVNAMGPEVAAVFDKIAGAEEKVAEVTKEVAKEQGTLRQGTLDLTETFRLQVSVERDLSTLSQEVLRRMQERQDAQAGVNRIVAEATEELRRQADAEQALADVVASNQVIINGASTNFGQLSGNIMKAEKAATALASGHSLGRVGPMLESVTLGLGGPAGLGMALGAAAFALEGMLPKIEAWVDKWDKGAHKVDQVKQALAGLDKASEISDRERALKRVDRQISKLEDKEDEQGWLSEPDLDKLSNLRVAAFNARRMIGEEKQVASAGQSKKQREAGSAVKEALAESGGGEAAARILADRMGISIDEANSIIAGAMEGGGNNIDSLKRNVPKFADMYSEIGPEGKAKKEAEKQRKHEEHQAALKAKQEERERVAYNREIEHEETAIWRESKQAEKHQAAEEKREAAHAKTKASHDAHLAEQARIRLARESTPEARFHHAQAAERNAIMGRVQQVDQANQAQGGRAASPDFMQHVASAAAQNVSMGADIATAVNLAVQQVQMKISQDFARGMRRQQVNSQSYLTP